MKLVVGTRASKLALTQCYQAITDLQLACKREQRVLLDAEFKLISTTGDEKQGTPEAAQLTKNAWVDRIEDALTGGDIDVAIHSGKDIPKEVAKGTALLPIGPRNRPFDVFVGKLVDGRRASFSELPGDASIGTASLRRRLFLQHHSRSFTIVPHRGNVPTRLRKLDESERLDGIILAAAGIRRLNMECAFEELGVDVMVPSALQGTLVAQFRLEDEPTRELLRLVVEKQNVLTADVERDLSVHLGADCKSCLGVYAFIEAQLLRVIVSAIHPQTLEQVRIEKEVALLSEGPGIKLVQAVLEDERYETLFATVHAPAATS